MYRYRKIRAKYPGECSACKGKVEPGDLIYWSRGSAPHHVDCETSRRRHTGCTACSGQGVRWNNAPCRFCDGTGLRDVQERNSEVSRRRNAERKEGALC